MSSCARCSPAGMIGSVPEALGRSLSQPCGLAGAMKNPKREKPVETMRFGRYWRRSQVCAAASSRRLLYGALAVPTEETLIVGIGRPTPRSISEPMKRD
eukprot:scaffold803_cov310-Pinguiococcus_pyrenoidosus.AAC.180